MMMAKIFISVLCALLVAAKILELTTLSWLWVFSPIWMSFVGYFLLAAAGGTILYLRRRRLIEKLRKFHGRM